MHRINQNQVATPTVGTLYHETFHRCHPSPVRWLANTQPSWVDAINGHSHNTLKVVCQATKCSTSYRVFDSGGALKSWNMWVLQYEAGWCSLVHSSQTICSIIMFLSTMSKSPSIQLLSSRDPRPCKLFWHTFWHTIWFFCLWHQYMGVDQINVSGAATIADQPQINRDTNGVNRGRVLSYATICCAENR